MYTVAVIGGGAAGMMAAIEAASCGANVHLFERQARVGKKLSVTVSSPSSRKRRRVSTVPKRRRAGSTKARSSPW